MDAEHLDLVEAAAESLADEPIKVKGLGRVLAA